MAKTATKVSKKAPAKKAAAPKAAAKAKTAKAPAKAAKKASAKTAVKKTAKASAATASPILTLRHIAERLSELHEVPKRQANEMMGQVIEMIAKSLKKGDKILPVRPRHPAGAQARCTHGPQLADRRAGEDQGFEEDRLPRGQGSQGIDLSACR